MQNWKECPEEQIKEKPFWKGKKTNFLRFWAYSLFCFGRKIREVCQNCNLLILEGFEGKNVWNFAHCFNFFRTLNLKSKTLSRKIFSRIATTVVRPFRGTFWWFFHRCFLFHFWSLDDYFLVFWQRNYLSGSKKQSTCIEENVVGKFFWKTVFFLIVWTLCIETWNFFEIKMARFWKL